MLSLFSRLLHRKARTGNLVIVNQHDIANSRRKQNPLAPLTPARVKQLYELYRDGKYADPMLAWEALEEFDETLATVVDRRQSALGEMQWNIATDAQAIGDDSALAALAEQQQEYLAAHFRRVANLTEAVKWLGMASFRKFAHLEVVKQGRDILWLPINQWLLFRPLHEGKWYYNQDVQNSPARGEELDESRLIVREVARPIDLPCMYLIVSKMHAITQWDGFLDVFGIPSMFIEMPQGTNEELRQEFIEVVNSVIGEGRGVLPSGAAVKTVETTASGGDTFTSRADWCDKGIVRRGTGGQLTVLTEAGSGTLAGNAQQETFRMLAAADAADIASVINRQYTRRVLEKKFEGQPHLAYWTLDYANENEQKQKTDAIVQLAAAGWRAKDETVSEIVGFEVTTAQPQAGAMPGAEGGAAPGGLLPNATPEEPDANIVTNRRMEADAAAGIYPGEFEEEDEEAASDDAAPMTEDELAALKSALAGGLNTDAIAADAAALEDAMQAAITEPEEAEEDAATITNKKGAPRGCGRPGNCKTHASTMPATRYAHKGSKKGRGNPNGRPTQSNTPLKAAPRARGRKEVDALERALIAQGKSGASGKVDSVITRGSRKISLSTGSKQSFGAKHLGAHLGQKGMTPRIVARAAVHGKGSLDIVGDENRGNREHRGFSSTVALEKKKSNKVERKRERNRKRKASYKNLGKEKKEEGEKRKSRRMGPLPKSSGERPSKNSRRKQAQKNKKQARQYTRKQKIITAHPRRTPKNGK